MRRHHVLLAGLVALSLSAARAGATGPTGGGGPTPTPSAVPLQTDMPAPTQLAFASDRATCDTARAGLPGTGTPSDLCLILPHPGAGIFYWNWQGNAAHPTAIGFRLYRTDGGHHDLVRETHASTPPIEGHTALVSGGLVTSGCYSVSAYDTSAESALTPPLCIAAKLPPGPGLVPHFPPLLPGPLAPGAAGARLPAPSRPTALKNGSPGTDQACSAHGGVPGARACDTLLPRGGLALVWDYGPAQIDGFLVYSVPGPSRESPAGRREGMPPAAAPLLALRAPVATQTARLETGHVASVAVLEPQPRGFADQCFAVAAFVAGEESEMSAPSCVAP